MNYKLFILIFIGVFILSGCSGNSTDNKEQGYLSVTVKEASAFNPNVEHGKIEKFKVAVTGDGLDILVIKEYPFGTLQAVIEGLPHKSVVQVDLSAINQNGLVVRHGLSDKVTIHGGKQIEVPLTLNNVPIFANVREGSRVFADRFVPSVFAPGEIEFELVDETNEQETVLPDLVSGDLSFSVSKLEGTSLKPVFIPQLVPGPHKLIVRDKNTHEESMITVNVMEATREILSTTAGAYIGAMTFNSQDIHKRSDLIEVQRNKQ